MTAPLLINLTSTADVPVSGVLMAAYLTDMSSQVVLAWVIELHGKALQLFGAFIMN